MTIAPHRNDFEHRLAHLERGTDAIDARLQEIVRTHREIVAQLQSMTEEIERTDAGVTHLCWTLDRITAALGIDDRK